MPTILTARTIPSTTIVPRDPVGRKYLATEDGKILTTEDGKWIIAVDATPTSYTDNRQFVGQTWDDLSANTWSSMSSSTWGSLYTGVKPTNYSGRIMP